MFFFLVSLVQRCVFEKRHIEQCLMSFGKVHILLGKCPKCHTRSAGLNSVTWRFKWPSLWDKCP